MLKGGSISIISMYRVLKSQANILFCQVDTCVLLLQLLQTLSTPDSLGCWRPAAGVWRSQGSNCVREVQHAINP